MMYKSLDMSLQIDRQSKKDPIELTVTDKIETTEEVHFHKWTLFQVTDGNKGLQLLQEFGSISCMPLSLSIVIENLPYAWISTFPNLPIS